jgi:Na+/H+-dicarboxylate symporter
VEGIGILIAVDAIPDLFATVLNATGDLAAAAFVARSSAPGVPAYEAELVTVVHDPEVAGR